MKLSFDSLSRRYNIDPQKLKYFAHHGLIEAKRDYSGEDEKRLGDVCTLHDIGLSADEIKKFLSSDEKERTKLLTAARKDILDRIHSDQRSLDRLDYILYELRKKKDI